MLHESSIIFEETLRTLHNFVSLGSNFSFEPTHSFARLKEKLWMCFSFLTKHVKIPSKFYRTRLCFCFWQSDTFHRSIQFHGTDANILFQFLISVIVRDYSSQRARIYAFTWKLYLILSFPRYCKIENREFHPPSLLLPTLQLVF